LSRTGFVGDALYLAWKLDTADAASAGRVQQLLARGEGMHLYLLRSWVVANGEVRALLAPSAPLEEITEAIWESRSAPTASRWIAGRRACAAMARAIETIPVNLGLAARPEEWPFSSAARE